MKRHINIPIFIPHLGCPNTCVFCNQRTISGVEEFKADDVITEIDEALKTAECDAECEIAFFGGSFTGIDRALMIRLLEIGQSYIKKGLVKSLRCSTRPDYICEEILDILKNYGVGTIELGLQSATDAVLDKCKRGHSAEDERRAAKLITEYGFDFVGQMMIGLPGATPEDEIKTAEFIISSGATGARIYPTVVFYGTELCDMAKSGEYTPLTNEEAVYRSARVYERFFEAGVKVIRIGLQSSENLLNPEMFYAGASHSAMGELVLGEFYFERIKKALLALGTALTEQINIYVPAGAVSCAVGQNKRNKLRLTEEFSLKSIKFKEDSALSFGEVKVGL